MEIENENEDQKSVDSFQAEMDLVREEEETENKLSQKERLAQMLENIKNQNTSENAESSNENQNQVLRANPNVLRAGAKKPLGDKPAIPEPFDPNFKLNERYFYQNISVNEWSEINDFIEKFIDENMDEKDLEEFFDAHPKISKGNVDKLKNTVENIFSKKQNLPKYKILINFLIKKYFKPKPVICECYFFPNPANEQRVVNMFRTCKKTLDVAIFTFTRDSIAQALLEAYQRGVKVRCIGDDGNSKVKGSDVRLLASVGIPCKTDNNLRFHMHNKMAILDNSVVITGSFNWTSQAVNKNQDNILFIEDKNIANQYTDYYNQIWNSFNTVITQEDAKIYLANEKKAEEEKKAQKQAQDKPAEKETTKKETTKKETTKKETTKKETTKKENKKETKKKETKKKETTKKKSESKPKTKKETTTTKKAAEKKETKNTAKKSKSESKPKVKKATTTQKKKATSTVKKSTKTTNTKTSKEKPKTIKEKKKEKNEKRKPATTKRVRGVKTDKTKDKKKKLKKIKKRKKKKKWKKIKKKRLKIIMK